MATDETIGITALHLWARKGYQGIGVQEICLEAGVTKPTLYHWFGSKLGLLTQVLAGGFSPLLLDLEKRARYQGDVKNALLGWMGAWMDYLSAHPQFMRLQLSLGTAPPDSEEYLAVRDWQDRLFGTLQEIFSCAARDHGNMTGREVSYALSFLGMMQTHGAAVLNGQITWSDQKALEMLHYFMHGIFS